MSGKALGTEQALRGTDSDENRVDAMELTLGSPGARVSLGPDL